MPSPRLALALRNLAAVALAAPAACAIENPGFMLAGPSTRTGTDTASNAGTTGAGAVDTGSSAAATTDPGPTSTTGTTLPVDTSSTSDGSSSTVPDTDGCIKTFVEIAAEADGFYIAGATDGGMTCTYAEELAGKASPCKSLNFGVTHGMRVARGGDEYDAMYAVRFAKSDLLQLKQSGVTSAMAELVLNVYAAPPAIDMRVGMITDQWFEGVQNAMPAKPGDSNFSTAKIEAMVDTKWSGLDGPRGASTQVTILSVPADYPDASPIKTGSFAIDAWLAAPDLAEGLVVSFFKDDAIGAEGPSINTRDHPNPDLHPFLRVHFCEP